MCLCSRCEAANAKRFAVRVCRVRKLKEIMTPLFKKHMDDIMSGKFSKGMMEDWNNDDVKLLYWREETGDTSF